MQKPQKAMVGSNNGNQLYLLIFNLAMQHPGQAADPRVINDLRSLSLKYLLIKTTYF